MLRRKALGSKRPDVFDSLEDYSGVLRKIVRNDVLAKMEARAKGNPG